MEIVKMKAQSLKTW